MKVAFRTSTIPILQGVSLTPSTARWTCTSSNAERHVSRRYIIRAFSLSVLGDGVNFGCALWASPSESSSIATTATGTVPVAEIASEQEKGELLDYRTTLSGLVIQDLRLGSGAMPSSGCEVRVRWTGRLQARFGWSYQPEAAEATYKWDTSELISGFPEGLSTMRAGGKRRLIVPNDLGYRTGLELPQPTSFGDRRRLVSTVANPRRTGGGAGAVVIDVELIRVHTQAQVQARSKF